MKQNQFEVLFADAFDTYKAFFNLSTQEAGRNLPRAPKTIWQILNHLIVWQGHKLIQLQDPGKELEIDEQATWPEAEQCDSQNALDQAITKLHDQLERVRKEITTFSSKDPEILRRLKITQDLSVHLAFHIGEIILMRRITANYPLPHQMKEFLQ